MMRKWNNDDLFYVCSMIEFVARKTHNQPKDIVAKLSDKELAHQLKAAGVNHCLSFEQICDEWIFYIGVYINHPLSMFTVRPAICLFITIRTIKSPGKIFCVFRFSYFREFYHLSTSMIHNHLLSPPYNHLRHLYFLYNFSTLSLLIPLENVL